MKATSSGTLTTALVVALLTAAGICVALRRAADDRRIPAAAGGTPTRVERDAGAAGTSRTGIGDRAKFRQRLRDAMSSGDPVRRAETLVEWIDGMNPADFPVLFEEMRSLCESGDPAMHLVLAAWAEVDPAAALEQDLKWSVYEDSTVLKMWVDRDPVKALAWLVENKKHGRVVDDALKALVKHDPAAALAWAKAHDEPMTGDRIAHPRLVAVLQAMLPGHLREVMEEMSRLPEEMRLSLIPPVSARIGRLSAEERRQWLDSFPPGDARDEAVAGMISEMGDLKERLELLADHPGAAGKARAGPLYQQWVRTDRQAAMDSLELIPPGPARNAAVVAVIDGLSDLREPREGLALMNRYPEAIDMGSLLNWVTSTANNHREWDLALATLKQVGNEAARNDIYRHVLDNWMRRDRTAARAWLDTHHEELPEAIQAAFEGR